jgi:D-glycero-D-manno-heptose 1,7-bisphosphate phosphatase
MNRIGIFLDRDGTINTEVDYLRSLSDLQLLPGAAAAIREANEMGWIVVVITNQSGVARGLFNEETLGKIHDELKNRITAAGASIDAVYYCPHHPDYGDPSYRRSCDCRKPGIGMLENARAEFGVDLPSSFVIGDRMIDLQTAANAHATPILVLTGYGRKELALCREAGISVPHIAEDLYDAIQIVKRLVSHHHVSSDHHTRSL